MELDECLQLAGDGDSRVGLGPLDGLQTLFDGLELLLKGSGISWSGYFAEARPVRWLCRRGIAGGGGLGRGGKELLLKAPDSGVALLQQLQSLLALE